MKALLKKIFGIPDKQSALEPEKKTDASSAFIIPLESGSMAEYIFAGGRLGASQVNRFYRQNGILADCIDKTAGRVEQVRPVMKDPDGKIHRDHPVLSLLRKPNAFNTWESFIGQISRHYQLGHNSFIGMLGNENFLPVQLYALKSENISPSEALDGYPNLYTITNGPVQGTFMRKELKGTARFFAPPFKEVYHIKGFSSVGNELWGDSPLESVALEIRQQLKSRWHNMRLLDNGGALSLVFTFYDPDPIDDEEHERRKARIREDLSGVDGAGRIAVLSGDKVDVREFGTSNKDMDYVNMEGIASTTLYNRFGIPLPLISTDASTYNNYTTAILSHMEDTVLPLVGVLFAGLTRALGERMDLKGWRIAYDPADIKVLVRQAIEELLKRAQAGVETTNELRSLLPHREPLSREADVLYQNASLVPIGTDLYTEDAYER